jgi:hypothetical protein
MCYKIFFHKDLSIFSYCMIILYLKYEHLRDVFSIKLTKKDVKWALKTIKNGEIFMFYHLKS